MVLVALRFAFYINTNLELIEYQLTRTVYKRTQILSPGNQPKKKTTKLKL